MRMLPKFYLKVEVGEGRFLKVSVYSMKYGKWRLIKIAFKHVQTVNSFKHEKKV